MYPGHQFSQKVSHDSLLLAHSLGGFRENDGERSNPSCPAPPALSLFGWEGLHVLPFKLLRPSFFPWALGFGIAGTPRGRDSPLCVENGSSEPAPRLQKTPAAGRRRRFFPPRKRARVRCLERFHHLSSASKRILGGTWLILGQVPQELVVPFYQRFWGEGSPTKIGYRKKAPLF